GRPEDGEGAVLARPALDRDRADRELVILAVGRGDLDAGVTWVPVAKRDRQRQLLDREFTAAWLAGAEAGAPFARAHLARLIEAQPEQLLGRLVVEEQGARLVDQERGRRQAGDHAPRLDQ